MQSKQQTITGELRKWQLSKTGPDGGGTVIGYMYNDVNDIWEDGDAAVVVFEQWVESANFYLAITHLSCIKCPKDEERVKDVAAKGSLDTPKSR